MTVRRARGAILRLVRRRPLAVTVGAALVAPAAWLEFSGRSGAWWLDGLGLVVLGHGSGAGLGRHHGTEAGLDGQ